MAERKSTTRAKGSGRQLFEYAAKFLCLTSIPGTSASSSSVLPGAYLTVVNIHNPSARRAALRMKIATTSPPAISKFVTSVLRPDGATKVDCDSVHKRFGLTFVHGIEGFLVIQSSQSLDVTAVYTAGPRASEVASIDVEQIRERRIG